MIRLVFAAATLALTSGGSIGRIEPKSGGVPIDSYPYQISVQIYAKHICGGALITPTHILTAGRCLYSHTVFPYEYEIHIGSNRSEGSEVIHLSDAVHHPYYKQWEIYWDVAVGTLERHVGLSRTVQTIALVPENQEPHSKDILTISGWGMPTSRSGDDGFLKACNVRYVEREECLVFLKAYSKKMNETMICADGNAGNYSDTGAPLVNDKKQLVGISTRLPIRLPGLYANLAHPPIHRFITENAVEKVEPHSY